MAPTGPITRHQAKLEVLRAEHGAETARAQRLISCVSDQLTTLLKSSGITLGVPMETRVKTWESINEKLERKALSLSSISDLDDLVGIRVILLFKKDEVRIGELIRENFLIIKNEDAAERLGESQFGYQSHHYIIQLKPEWLTIPSYRDLGSLKVEIQARTLAQHMWAATSHKLQYKRESSVPLPLRRAIHRVSALLETVDLEFDRVLEGRVEYVSQQEGKVLDDTLLNVDLVEIVADRSLPPQNKDDVDGEDFEALLIDLIRNDISTTDQLEALIRKHYDSIINLDKKYVREVDPQYDDDPERTGKGVFFTFVGLIREALVQEYGQTALQGMRETDPIDWYDDLPP